ncbi:MarR family transcriptional regulator [Shewanella sp. AS16]|uniref:MarR family winged helix-turn-helix transcriptional regulator n=1 Tax=Shewanella sp. AS16 TaxID=2907625 RepID=UPI001F1F7DBB|nr:MarR family transcriptional regulator [Shewanella sp. AS16]MCE9685471.1 MarR family transcriptional regulator [Shewanella sp. AS16]
MERSPEGQLFTDIILEVFKLSGLLATAGDRLTRDQQMSSARWKVLGALARSPSPMTVSQIAQSMGQSRQGVQRIANELLELGVLVFEENPLHKKAKLLVLTAKGFEVLQQIEAKQIPWANACAQGMDVTEMTQALAMLRKLAQVC